MKFVDCALVHVSRDIILTIRDNPGNVRGILERVKAILFMPANVSCGLTATADYTIHKKMQLTYSAES